MDRVAIHIHPYHLSPRESLNALSCGRVRRGVLLKVTYADGIVGYADCHPWEELGDDSIDRQISNLRSKKISQGSLLEKSLYYARIDAEARRNKKHLLNDLNIPLSHYLCVNITQLTQNKLDEIRRKGYQTIKIKIGRQPEAEADILNELSLFLDEVQLKLRFDFNESLTYQQYHRFIEKISSLQHMIEFVEDPYPYDPKKWEQTRKETKILLACDRLMDQAQVNPDSYDLLIWKPAVQNRPRLPKGKRLIVTTYFDHPIGQMIAAYEAAQHCPDEICGLQTHLYYQEDHFMKHFSTHGPTFLNRLEGTGFGFDTIFNSLEWKDVN